MESVNKSISNTESTVDPYLNVVVKCEFDESEVKTDNETIEDTAINKCAAKTEEHRDIPETIENQCKLCNEQFLNGDYLKQHLIIHVGEAPYECMLCEKTFCRKDR